LLNGRAVWLFHNTEVTSKGGKLLIFVSNTAAHCHAPERNITLLLNFEIFASRKQSTGREQGVTADQTLIDGG
jgi:hypothetical protein